MDEDYKFNLKPYNAFIFNKTRDGIYVNDCMGYIMEKKQTLYIVDEMIKFVNKYENDIKDYNKQNKIKNENTMSELYSRKKKKIVYGYVYFIECGGKYKIGFSKNIKRRLKELDKRPFELKIIKQSKLSDNAYKMEQYLHKKYKKYRIKDEWYNFSKEQIKEIILLIDEIDEV